MKFYIMDHENDLKMPDDEDGDQCWADEYKEATQYTLKEARELCLKFNGPLSGDIKKGECRTMMPVPPENQMTTIAKVEMMYYIWSFQKDAWWRPREHGYTKLLPNAGAYSFEAAMRICAKANVVLMEEAMVPITMAQVSIDEPCQDKYVLSHIEDRVRVYWKERGTGNTPIKEYAFHYSKEEAEKFVKQYKDATHPVTLEKVND